MVPVSLMKLVGIPGTAPAWPEEFAGKVEVLKDEPNERAAWGVLADWLDENDEPELGRACRWLSNRPTVLVVNSRRPHGPPYWSLEGMPPAVGAVLGQAGDRMTLPGLAADLARALAELDKAAT